MTGLYIFWLATHLATAALGYWFCVTVRWYRTVQRERALRALGGQLPDWEVAARKLEAEALESALRHSSHAANELRRHADITRQRGRRRDREWQ